MVQVKLEIKIDANATLIHATRAITGQLLKGIDPPKDARIENWSPHSWWDFTKKFGVVCTSGNWATCYDNNVLLKPNCIIPLGFDDNTASGWTYVQMRLTIAGKIVKEVSFDNLQNDMALFYLSGFVEAPTPTYLETLDKLDQWSSAQYIPNSGNKLNL